MPDPFKSFRERLRAGPDFDRSHPALVACSGGGDSVALLHMTVRALGADRVQVVTINHNLRPEAADDVALVARHAGDLGVLHIIRTWTWNGTGNLQAAAREARRQVLSEEAARRGAPAVLLGHTADDQAETFLLRLARGSGVDGLAGMRRFSPPFLRPLIGCRRADLRSWLQGEGLIWAEDPSNNDMRFDRVRARAMAATLADLGLSHDRIIATTELMRRESAVLHRAARLWAEAHVTAEGGDILIPRGAFLDPGDAKVGLQTRVLAGLVQWFSGSAYKPRLSATELWIDTILKRGGGTLGGVVAATEEANIRFRREESAMQDAIALRAGGREAVWDHRWHLTAADSSVANLTIGALGGDLRACPDRAATGLGAASLYATPAIRRDGNLIAAPLAGLENGWQARLRPTFTTFLDSH